MKRFKNNKQFVIGVGFILCLLFLFPNQVLASVVSVENIYNEINIERQKANIPDLTINDTLTHIAEIRANDMSINNYFSHKNPEGLMPWDYALQENYNYQIIGENLAIDWLNTEETVKAWMKSSTHKENILNARYTETGIAVITNNSHTLIVQIFGRQHLSPTTILPAVRANTQNIEINTDVSDDLIKNEQTVLRIIPNNSNSENKQVLGTTFGHNIDPESKNINYSQYFLILVLISFLPLSLSLLLLKPKNSK